MTRPAPGLDRRRFLARSLAAMATAGSALALGCARGGSGAPAAVPGTSGAGPGPGAPDPGAAGAGPSAPDSFAALAGFCDGIAPPDAAELEARRERARRLARDAGFDALVMEAGSTLCYVTGARWGLSERPLLYLLPVAGDPVWIGPAFEEGSLRAAFVGQDALRTWHEHESPYALAARALVERGARGRIAVDPAMRLFVYQGLQQALAGAGPALANGQAVVDGCRAIKSQAELARLRRANQATKAALAAAAALVRPGMREPELAALVRRAQEAAGLTSVWVLALSGPNAAYPHGTDAERPLAEGDLVLVDTGGSLHGYRSDITRTWVLGTPTSAQRRAWDTVRAAQRAALDAIRPGVTCGAVDARAREVMERAGHGGDYERFTHRLGHGIGLDVHEPPYLVRGSDRVLVPGMTMSCEPGLYVPGSFGIRIEDIVAVTEQGSEVFGPRARSLDAPFE